MASQRPSLWPLHYAAAEGDLARVQELLQRKPSTALQQDNLGALPLHIAAWCKTEAVARRLLEAAPEAALKLDSSANLPLHVAARYGRVDSVRLLLAAAPKAAAAKNWAGRTPLEEALEHMHPYDHDDSSGSGPGHLEAAALAIADGRRYAASVQLLLAALSALSTEQALAALGRASHRQQAVLPLYASLAAKHPLLPKQWQQVPAGCPDLAAALPAVLARSEVEAGCLVGLLSGEERCRLRTAALGLAGAQRRVGVLLHQALAWRVLALSLE